MTCVITSAELEEARALLRHRQRNGKIRQREREMDLATYPEDVYNIESRQTSGPFQVRIVEPDSVRSTDSVPST